MARILPELTHVRLPQGKVLWNMGDAIPYAFFDTRQVAKTAIELLGHDFELGDDAT